MDLINNVNNLRKRICQYRAEKFGFKEISTHINAVDIALALTELGVKDNRAITKEEQEWFKAGLYLAYIFENSEWEDIVDEYNRIVAQVEKLSYFRK